MAGNDGSTRTTGVNRRDVLKGATSAAAAAVAVGLTETAQAAETPGPTPAAGYPQNSYGGGPNTGITLPPYYRSPGHRSRHRPRRHG